MERNDGTWHATLSNHHQQHQQNDGGGVTVLPQERSEEWERKERGFKGRMGRMLGAGGTGRRAVAAM